LGKSLTSSTPVNVNSTDCQQVSNNSEHIIVDIIIKLTDSRQFNTFALIDSGSMENFCDINFAAKHNLPLMEKSAPVEILTVDGSPISSGKVTQDSTVQMSMGSHTERIKFSITKLGQYPVILGIPWLKKHDPRITWSTNAITFDSNTCVHSCFENCHSIKALPIHPKFSRPTAINLSLFDQTPVGNNIDCINKSKSFDAYPNLSPTCDNFPNVDIQFVSYASIKKDLTDDNSCYITPSEVIRIAEYPTSHYIAATSSTSNSELTATKEDYSNVPDKYSAFYEVFSKKKANTLPPHRPYDHQIILQEGKKPPFGPIYSLSQVELDELAKYLKENLANGFISRSTSPAAAPILFVKKKSGELRLCIDNRGLNAVTVRDPPVLPLVSEMIDRLGNALYYTKLDVRNAYYRIRIKQGQEWLTGFRCKYGHFQYNVLNFGLVNAPSTWMAYLNDVLREHIDQTAVFFYDDILVFTNGDLDQHTKDVKAILQKLLDAELYIKAEKCEFDKTEVDFLGIRIGRNGVSMDNEKIKAIIEWPTPKSQHDIQVFLGFANYHRAFLKHYSKYTTPLTNLLQKGKNFKWEEKEEIAFNALKSLFTSKPVLKIFSPDKPCIMETDASDFAIGSVLSQYDDNNVLHPIAYFSRKLKAAEINYEIYDKEMLAIIDSFAHWRHYLQDTPHKTLVLTDHRNLEYFLDAKKLNRRQARYAIKLIDYNFVIQYRSATQNQRADALSRRPDFEPDEYEKQPIQTLLKPDQLRLSATQVTNCDISMDVDLQKRLLDCQKHDPAYNIVTHRDKLKQSTVSRYLNYSIDEYTGLLLKNSLVYVPNNDDIKLELLRIHHDNITSGHFGRAKTIELLSRNYWWKGMTNFVNRYVANCQICIRGKPSRQAPQGPLRSLQIPDQPWESISMDFIVKLPKSKGFDSIFVVVDRLTKMAHFIPCNESMSAKELATLFIDNIFRLHGFPTSIVSDRGALFTSKFWQHLLKNLDVKANMSTAYRPETDGQTERTNSTLEQYLRMYCNYQQNNWSQLLSTAEFSYNNHCQSSTKFSPFFVNYGYNPKANVVIKKGGSECVPASEEFLLQLKQTQDESKTNIAKAQTSQALYYNQGKRQIQSLKIGDQVYINSKNITTTRPMKKLDHKRLGPFKIVEKVSSHAYKLDLPTSMKIHPTFHISKLTPRTIKGLSDIGNRELPPLPPIIVNSNEEYEVDQILDSRIYRKKLQYKVKWKGYEDPSEDTWEDRGNLENAQSVIKQFHQDYPHKPSPSSTKDRPRT
jgi:hypothetical protein